MTMHVILDRTASSVAPSGYHVIDTEVEFLRRATDRSAHLFIRGARLCEWAESYLRGRQISFGETRSFLAVLQSLMPGLTEVSAREIASHLTGVASLDLEDLTLDSLLNTLFPSRLWNRVPSREHAAEWLLWLHDTKPEAWASPLLKAIASQWCEATHVSAQIPYEAVDATGAAFVLDGWLGIAEMRRYRSLGRFPSEIPSSLKDKARNAWRLRIIESQGKFLNELRTWELPEALMQVAAKVAHSYYQTNPEFLDEQTLQFLAQNISPREVSDLRVFLKPKLPGDLPETPDGILAWFRKEYLPYRMWQSTKEYSSDSEAVGVRAREFTHWYLDNYPLGLVGGPLNPHLSFMRSNRLSRDTNGSALLVVVLDGLHVSDAQYLQMKIQQGIPRLVLATDALVFAPVPTITRFCKEALLRGVAPKNVANLPTLGVVLPENESPVEHLSGLREGQIYLWRVQEPDRTYHHRNTYDSLRREVEVQLDGVALKVADIVGEVPSEVTLQIVITTDHGRLLANSERAIEPPVGMEIHGRTAWGQSTVEYPTTGYVIEGDIAYLHGERFGLLTDTAIVLSEGAFLGADGRRGSELYPHGGLYPEEVIVPWIVYARDAVPPEVDLRASGSGKAGKRGEIELKATNLGAAGLRMRTLKITGWSTNTSISVEQYVDGQVSSVFVLPVEKWPPSKEARASAGILVVEQPNGLVFELTVEMKIESEEMYQQEDILEGLDL